MKFTILSRSDETSQQIKETIREKLQLKGLIYDEDKPELIISVGGDGTMLEAFHRHQHMLADVAFVGVHTGRLGFYADWLPQEIDELIQLITETEIEVVEYPLLEVNVYHMDGQKDYFLALNECTIKTQEGTLVMDVEVNDEHFETFRGDGLCISTPSGSTAYNKSLGGAILHPKLSAIQLAEMASINNRVFRTIGSPLVIPDHHTLILTPRNNVDYQVTIDHMALVEKNVSHIHLFVAQEKVRFARFRPFPFWKRVRESFIE